MGYQIAALRMFAVATGTMTMSLAVGCIEPGYRTEVVSANQGQIELRHVPKPPQPPSQAAPHETPPPAAPSLATPLTFPTDTSADEVSRQQRVKQLEERVREINTEIDRLNAASPGHPTTAPAGQ